MPRRPPTHKPPLSLIPDGRPSACARGYNDHWRKLRRAILHTSPICELCERAAATDVDHIVPLARGGTHERSNLQALCGTCHKRKSVQYDGALGRPKREVR